jgi:cytoskeletal protein RodZ
MKVCPKCGQAFNDDNLSYCLLDGEQLVAGSEPTLVIPPKGQVNAAAAAPKKKRKTFLWIALALIVVFIGGAILVAVAYVSYRFGSERARSNKVASANTSSTPVSNRSSAATTPSPATSPSTSPDEEDADEVIPILWNTTATQVKPDVGSVYKFECPKSGTAAAVWGSDTYTTDSSVCTAAVHAGKITLADGGQVTIEMRPGRSIYGSTTRNGITSSTYGQYPNSFVVR